MGFIHNLSHKYLRPVVEGVLESHGIPVHKDDKAAAEKALEAKVAAMVAVRVAQELAKHNK